MNEIAKKAENGLGLEGMLRQAELFVKSGFFPKHVDTKEKALVIMMKGKELGLPFTESLSKIAVIQGVATTKVETLLGLARRTGQMEDFKQKFFPNELNPQYCEITIKRKGQSPHVCRFGDEEAKTMGLDGKDNYKKQKATMYSWRAIAKNLRVTFPDAIGGLYLEEEIADDVIIQSTGDAPHEAIVTEIIETERQIEAPRASSETSVIVGDDKTANWVIPFGKYKGLRLIEIYAQTTETGQAKGKEYLEWCATSLKNEDAKDIITRFLSVMDPKEINVDAE